MKTAEDNLLK